jgi:hypothetical protein
MAINHGPACLVRGTPHDLLPVRGETPVTAEEEVKSC